jgi:ABC-type multidrug transport system fused ATPase/permease subunit
VTARLTKELFSRPITFIQQRSSQETASALLQGAGAATIQLLGQAVAGASEMVLLIILGGALVIVDPPVALGAIAFFAFYGVALQRVLGNRVSKVGTESVQAEIASLRSVQEALGAYREIYVADRRALYIKRIQDLRVGAAQAASRLQTLYLLPKYAAEVALVAGAFALAAVLFSTKPLAVAAGTFALFIATVTRAMPSLLRLQSAALAVRAAAAAAAPTFALAQDLGHPREAPQAEEALEAVRRVLKAQHDDFVPRIEMRDVKFTYPGAQSPAIPGLSLVVEKGQSVAFVGRSGAGKSTLADVILGVLQPDGGEVAVGGIPPADAIRRWPGAIAYVPQDVTLVNDSIRANVALGLPADAIDDDLVWDALRRAHLSDYLRSEKAGLDTQVGERGVRISGGQRQRLGIARALFTGPRLLVLDEATSALDAEAEHAITTMVNELEGDVTTLIIAHRLSTIRHVNLVVYLDHGNAAAMGTFDEVCTRIPALRRQADLMGLQPGRQAQ